MGQQEEAQFLDFSPKKSKSTSEQVITDRLTTESPTTPIQQKPLIRPLITKPAPPSDILSRVAAFLPHLKTSNEALNKRNPEDYRVDQVDRSSGQPYIQMNLGIGIFDVKDQNVQEGNGEDVKGSEDLGTGEDCCTESDTDDDDDIAVLPSQLEKKKSMSADLEDRMQATIEKLLFFQSESDSEIEEIDEEDKEEEDETMEMRLSAEPTNFLELEDREMRD